MPRREQAVIDITALILLYLDSPFYQDVDALTAEAIGKAATRTLHGNPG